MGAIFEELALEPPGAGPVTTSNRTVTGVDGDDITLFVSRPADTAGPLPGVLHLHGGGMAIGSAADLAYIRLREHLAATGLVVVGVEFRNSARNWATTRSRPGSTTAHQRPGGSAPTATPSASPVSSRRGNPAAGT